MNPFVAPDGGAAAKAVRPACSRPLSPSASHGRRERGRYHAEIASQKAAENARKPADRAKAHLPPLPTVRRGSPSSVSILVLTCKVERVDVVAVPRPRASVPEQADFFRFFFRLRIFTPRPGRANKGLYISEARPLSPSMARLETLRRLSSRLVGGNSFRPGGVGAAKDKNTPWPQIEETSSLGILRDTSRGSRRRDSARFQAGRLGRFTNSIRSKLPTSGNPDGVNPASID